MRASTINKLSDYAGDYEQEVFDCQNTNAIIIGVHGNGVRRWDGKKFYYQVAEHFKDNPLLLVDQNQPENGGCRLNAIEVMVSRNQELIKLAKSRYPGVPIWIVAHSMGCGIASMLDLTNVKGVILVAPAVGTPIERYKVRYGEDVVNGKIVTTTGGLYKNMTKEFIQSVSGINWQNKYLALLSKFPNVHVFESGDDEIIDEERFELRNMPFASYTIINNAPHDYFGEFSDSLFSKIDVVLI